MAKVALITGGSRGIGRAVSRRLARNGFHVLINYRDNHLEAEKTLCSILEEGNSAELCPFDITAGDRVAASLDVLLSRHSVDLLVFNAGIRHDRLLVLMTEKQWRDVMETNLLSVFGVMRPIVKQMLLNRSGTIILITSTSGQSGMAGQAHYAASKAGLIGVTKALALECAGRGVLVNAVAPGFIQTDMISDLRPEEIIPRIPLGRIGSPDEVAGVVSFLASKDAGYMTGQVIAVNGGAYL